jgi:hypothetical protein
MKKYKILTDLYKLSESKHYKAGEEIELTEEEAKPLIDSHIVKGLVIETKVIEAKVKRNPKS